MQPIQPHVPAKQCYLDLPPRCAIIVWIDFVRLAMLCTAPGCLRASA